METTYTVEVRNPQSGEWVPIRCFDEKWRAVAFAKIHDGRVIAPPPPSAAADER